MAIRVTVEDIETGESEVQEVSNDYVIICEGSCYISNINVYPNTGTQVVTIRGRKN